MQTVISTLPQDWKSVFSAPPDRERKEIESCFIWSDDNEKMSKFLSRSSKRVNEQIDTFLSWYQCSFERAYRFVHIASIFLSVCLRKLFRSSKSNLLTFCRFQRKTRYLVSNIKLFTYIQCSVDVEQNMLPDIVKILIPFLRIEYCNYYNTYLVFVTILMVVRTACILVGTIHMVRVATCIVSSTIHVWYWLPYVR